MSEICKEYCGDYYFFFLMLRMFGSSAVMTHCRGRLKQLGLQDLLPRWLLHQMCGTLAGMARRLGSAAAISPRAYMWLSQHGCFRVVGCCNSEIYELVFKRMMWKLHISLWPFLRSHWVSFML